MLHLAPPLHVQARVWHGGEVVSLKGHFRDLRTKYSGLPDVLPLASERLVVSYATGVVLMGRFLPNEQQLRCVWAGREAKNHGLTHVSQ